MNALKILIVDDEKRYRDEIGEYLIQNNFSVFKASLPSEAFEILQKNDIDIIILDIRLPEMDGIKVLKKVKESFPGIEVIMVTGHGDMQRVIESMRFGANEFITKPFSLLDIQSAIKRTERFIAIENKLEEAERHYSLVSKELYERIGNRIIGNSPSIESIIESMTKVANSNNTTVLITGESGTGKELVARGIHYISARKDNYFYDVNCPAIPENLFESEFFGHKKGAFTGAIENKIGCFEKSNRGTVFLDEICDLPIIMQSKLLRTLEEREIRQLGSHKKITIDVRIIAATNKDIKTLCEEGKFRIDLYHRITSFVIHISPLRERKEDIPLLFEYFVKYYSTKMKKHIKKKKI